MHYDEFAFSKNDQPTIETLNGEDIGQRSGLSDADVEAVNFMYPLSIPLIFKPGLYTIQQKSNGRFVDAHEYSGKDFGVVTRPAQNNRTAAYEIADYLQAIDQLTVTTLRNVIGSMDLERTLTSREEINTRLRIVLDEATGKWGIRVNRVEIKAIDPPVSIKEAMEKQMRAERDKRAAILHAEGERQSKTLPPKGLASRRFWWRRATSRLRSCGPTVRPGPSIWFSRLSIATTQIPRSWPTSTSRLCLTWQAARTTPSGSSQASFTQAIRAITEAFGDYSRMGAPSTDKGKADSPPLEIYDVEDSRELTSGGPPRLDAVAAADRVAELAEAAVDDARARSCGRAGHEA